MSDDKLRSSGGDRLLPAEYTGIVSAPTHGGESYPTLAPEAGEIDWRRYAFVLFRYKWMLVLALVVAGAASYFLWQTLEVRYTAEGSLWIERGDNGDAEPIRPSSLFGSDSNWRQLMLSYSVLDSVVVAEHLYVDAPTEYSEAFHTLTATAASEFGDYELRIDSAGAHYRLLTTEGATVEEGSLGGSIGATLGYDWTPPAGAFAPGAVVRFSVRAPREAAQLLAAQLVVGMPPEGTFLEVGLDGTDPVHITATVNALLRRFVEVAAELTRAKLDETLLILQEQLEYTEDELADAERTLEEFRVRTISLPSDRSAPISPGLQLTRDPVFSSFFEMRVELEQVRRDRERLESALGGLTNSGEVRIESLELIPLVRESSELRRILDDLVEARSQVRVLRDRYSDDYAPLQELLAQVQTIETRAVPRVVQGIIAELAAQERSLEQRVAAATVDLEAIPPRTIEEGRLERSVNITEALYNDLRGRVETARLAAASSIPDVRILDEAQVPQVPNEDNRLRFILMLFLGSLGAAMGGALLLDRMDARFRYATDVSRDIGLAILGSIPRIHGGSKQGVLNAAQALEAFRELRIHIGFAYGSAGPITLTVSSPAAGEGKSLISSNLAVAFAEVGQRTLLIDGDTRRGDAHRLFGLEQSPGLIDYLKERSGQEIIQETAHDNLHFIGCGSRGTSTPELLASPRMAHLMGTLKRSYDVIIMDSPPLASGGDPLILSTLTGNLAVVIRTGATDKQLTLAKLEQLSRLPIRVLGAILNDVDPADGYHYYYASYLPGYEPVPAEGDDEVQLISDERSQAS
jgi:capsular exopolysaccharide synthesis family protein